VGLAQQRHPKKISLGLFAHFTQPNKILISASAIFSLIPVAELIMVATRTTDLGGDAASVFDAESPGSGGASPYLRRGFQRGHRPTTSPRKFSLGLFAHFTQPNKILIPASVVHLLSYTSGRAYRGRHSNELILGCDAAGEFDAESPGSGGASPYLRRHFGKMYLQNII
jgi:hypothetical protein